MSERFPVLAAWRRMVALVVGLGVGAAVLVANPLAPAYATGLGEPPAASSTTQTVSLTGHATTSGAIGLLSNPLDITCNLTVTLPEALGPGFLDSRVEGVGHTYCFFDSDGLPATVPRIAMRAELVFNGAIVNGMASAVANGSQEFTLVNARPCRYGTWTHSASVIVTFPWGEVKSSPVVNATDTISHCPGDPVVPNIIGMTVSQARQTLTSKGLTWSEGPTRTDFTCTKVGLIAEQSPGPETPVGQGSNVLYQVWTWPGRCR